MNEVNGNRIEYDLKSVKVENLNRFWCFMKFQYIKIVCPVTVQMHNIIKMI